MFHLRFSTLQLQLLFICSEFNIPGVIAFLRLSAAVEKITFPRYVDFPLVQATPRTIRAMQKHGVITYSSGTSVYTVLSMCNVVQTTFYNPR